LSGRHADDRHHLVHDLAHPRGPRVQLDPSRLQAGDVEEVVDEIAEPLGAAKDRLLVLELARAQRSVHLAREQAAVADDRGERRPQLVADHGQELRLELVEAPQLLVHLGQRACLAILLRVLGLVFAHEPRRLDEDLVAAAQEQEGECDGRGEPVDDDQGDADLFRQGRRRPYAHGRPEADAEEDEGEDHAERLHPLRGSIVDGPDDEDSNTKGRGRKDQVGQPVE
jgi:hypothetical protein